MTRFFPIYVSRSDGQFEVLTSRGKEKNEPSAEQLDRTPNAKGVADYYREIAHDEPKHLDWRKKLAGMLAREIPGQAERAPYCVLERLPEGYRLYEHIKSRATDKDGNPQPTKKNHAGGGHDRQDAYLYGHPQGPRKRFRSPADFFPHLQWLVTDPAGDPDNCSCKICCPEEIEDKSTAAKDVKPSPMVKKEEPAKPRTIVQIPVLERPKSATPNPYAPPSQASPPQQNSTPRSQTPHVTPTPQPQVQQKPPQQQVQPQQQPQPQQKPQQQAQPHTPQQNVPSIIPQPRSTEQQIDAMYSRFAYRPGEVAWFNRGQSWGLAVIIKRSAVRNAQEEVRSYILQALSYPLSYQNPVTIINEKLMRPWLAWSPPNYTHKWLNDNPTTFENADWLGLVQERYGPGDCEVDGMILAARAVDASYTLFDLVKKSVPSNGMEDRSWNGMFLGGEKMWVGDPVRLKIGQGSNAIMVVIEIHERVEQRGNNITSNVILRGDVYTLSKSDVPQNQDLPNDQHLPIRMREDLRWRNAYTYNATGSRSYWKLQRAMASVHVNDIKGRWYESSFLLPLLTSQPQSLADQLRRGDVQDPIAWLNARGDATSISASRNILNRAAERRDAFGKAIPAHIKIMDGVDPLPHQHAQQQPTPAHKPQQTPQVQHVQQPPQQPQQQQQQHQIPSHHHHQQQQHAQVPDPLGLGMDHFVDSGQGALDEFMNLDGMDQDGLAGFGHEFGAQGAGPGYF